MEVSAVMGVRNWLTRKPPVVRRSYIVAVYAPEAGTWSTAQRFTMQSVAVSYAESLQGAAVVYREDDASLVMVFKNNLAKAVLFTPRIAESVAEHINITV